MDTSTVDTNPFESIFDIFDINQMFSDMIGNFLGDQVTKFYALMDSEIVGLLEGMLYTEKLVQGPEWSVLGPLGLEGLYQFIYAFACALIVLKFLFKGFQVYILWRDGDAETSPFNMLQGAMMAVFVMVGFPVVYGYMADITLYLGLGLLGHLGGDGQTIYMGDIVETLLASGVVFVVVMVVYCVLYFMLWIQLTARGFELLVMRLGVPIACLGLLDSDGGMFKGYMQIMVKTLMTSVIQIALMSCSLKIMSYFSMGNLIIGIAAAVAAVKIPNLMQQLLVNNRQGGGITSKLHSTSMMVNGIKGIFRK